MPNCKHCDTPLGNPKWGTPHGFCSLKCWNHDRKHEPICKPCEICEENFYKRSNHGVKRWEATRFCSKECQGQAYSMKRRGIKLIRPELSIGMTRGEIARKEGITLEEVIAHEHSALEKIMTWSEQSNFIREWFALQAAT